MDRLEKLKANSIENPGKQKKTKCTTCKKPKEVVVEKDRGWSGDVALIRKLTERQPQILSPVRPIPEIIASFMLISNKIGKQSLYLLNVV